MCIKNDEVERVFGNALVRMAAKPHMFGIVFGEADPP
jgi:hypothetical protein